MGGLYEWCMWVVCMSGVYVATHDSTGRLRRQKVMAEMVKKQVMFIKVCVVVVVFVVVFVDVVVVVVFVVVFVDVVVVVVIVADIVGLLTLFFVILFS